MSVLVPGQMFDSYRIDAWIGRGAQAAVYRAHQAGTERDVALKVFGNTLDPASNERFLREARAGARFSHPRIVMVYDCNVHRGMPYIAMRLVRGPSLGEVLAKGGPLPRDRALSVLADVAEALTVVHDADMVHRDVKPANVLLDPDGRANLSDFGIAFSSDMPRLTQHGQFIGTVEYTAPEVIRGEDATRASDVYSFGVLAYEALTGRLPFTGADPGEVSAGHLNQAPPSVRGIRSELPLALDAALARALAKSPESRDISAVEVVEAVRRAFDGWDAPEGADPADAGTTRLLPHWSGEAPVRDTRVTPPRGGEDETVVAAPAVTVPPARRRGRLRNRVTLGAVALLLAGAGGAYGAWQYLGDRVDEAEAARETSYRTGFANGRTKGLAAGREEGRTEGLTQGRAEGRAEGITQGRIEGRKTGLQQGRKQGKAEGVRQGRTVPNAQPGDFRLVQVNSGGFSEYVADPLSSAGGCFIIGTDGDVRTLQARGLFNPCSLLGG
ncbi:MAG: protein kinase [Actinobacteria bacterium]|nr:protein kinase [Thermoleophilia bacterium]MCB9011314.1 protein kinase [Actinomycetota bacterium]